jgi:hypothetical protein
MGGMGRMGPVDVWFVIWDGMRGVITMGNGLSHGIWKGWERMRRMLYVAYFSARLVLLRLVRNSLGYVRG